MATTVLVVGAEQEPHGLKALGERLNAAVEWTKGTTRMVSQAERRVRAGTVAGLIVLDGFMPHRMFDTLLAASRTAAVPFAYGGRGGKGALTAAGDALAAVMAARRVA